MIELYLRARTSSCVGQSQEARCDDQMVFIQLLYVWQSDSNGVRARTQVAGVDSSEKEKKVASQGESRQPLEPRDLLSASGRFFFSKKGIAGWALPLLDSAR